MPQPGAIGPNTPVPQLQQQAQALFKRGRLRDALNACQMILMQQPERADVHAFAGMISMRLGDPAQAVQSYGRAVELRPDHAEAHFNLGNAFKQLDRPAEAEQAYRRVLALRPDLAPAWHNLGNVLLVLDRPAESADALQRVLEIDPRNPDTHRNLGIALQKLGRHDQAIAAYRGALALRPGWPPASSNLVQVLLAERKLDAAIAACDDWLALYPGHVEGLALKCAALNEAGDAAGRDYLLDFDRFVLARAIEPPAGYKSLDEFNAGLADYVLNHPTLKLPPEDDPTYHHPKLHITDEILGETGGPMADMEQIMTWAVEDYWQRMGDDPSHPFLANRPRKWRLSAWSVVLQGEGNLVSHIHLDGYLGGAYYVKVPQEVYDEDKQEGWFELGRPPEELPLEAPPAVRRYQSVPGKMLQFPGYFYHRTTPYHSPASEIRITIAFDVVPVD